jgi:hypothetical protein
MELVMRKKAKRNPASKPKSRKVEGGPVTTKDTGQTEKTNRRQGNRVSRISSGPCPATAKDKEELIRIWDEDLCE